MPALVHALPQRRLPLILPPSPQSPPRSSEHLLRPHPHIPIRLSLRQAHLPPRRGGKELIKRNRRDAPRDAAESGRGGRRRHRPSATGRRRHNGQRGSRRRGRPCRGGGGARVDATANPVGGGTLREQAEEAHASVTAERPCRKVARGPPGTTSSNTSGSSGGSGGVRGRGVGVDCPPSPPGSGTPHANVGKERRQGGRPWRRPARGARRARCGGNGGERGPAAPWANGRPRCRRGGGGGCGRRRGGGEWRLARRRRGLQQGRRPRRGCRRRRCRSGCGCPRGRRGGPPRPSRGSSPQGPGQWGLWGRRRQE